MNASLYILLPVGDELLNLALNDESLRDMMAPLALVKDFARRNGINLRVFFDYDNVTRFKADMGVVVDDGVYMEKPSNILRWFIGSNSTDVKNVRLFDAECSYIRWDTVTCSIDPELPLVIKSAFESTDAPFVFSLLTRIPTDYCQVSIIKDRMYANGLPDLRNIPLFCRADECIEWLSSLLDGHFSLIGNKDFERTSMRWIKQCIFRKISDNTYWYFDYFHKDNKIHYEVFNSEGTHIGEASEKGTLMSGTVDKKKSIKRILHGD